MCTRDDYAHLMVEADDVPLDQHPLVVWARSLRQSRREVAYALTPGGDDYVAADPAEPSLPALTEAPFWVVIDPAGRVSWRFGKPTLTDLQSAVGGYIEVVPHDGDFTAYCDEEGKLNGQPVNSAATIFLGVRGDILMGPVVLIGGPDDEGEDTPLPAAVRQRLVSEVIDA
jgi:hypothetical protein